MPRMGMGMGVGVGGVSRWTPARFSNLALQLQADKGAATGALWTDQSSAGKNATQGTGAQQMAFSATAYNGKPGFTADGSNDHFVLGNFATGAKTMCLTLKQSSTPGGSTLRSPMRLRHAASESEILVINFAGYKQLSFICDFTSDSARGIDLPFDTNPHTIIVTWDGVSTTASSSYKVYVDGNRWLVGVSSTINWTAAGVSSIGGRNNGTTFELYDVPGVFQRALVYEAERTAADVIRLHDWLARGWTDSPVWTPQVVCVGDSLTLGQAASADTKSYPERMLVGLGTASAWGMLNLGVGGRMASEMVTLFPTNAAPLYNPARSKNVLCVMAGTNDIGNGASSDATIASIASLCAAGQAAGYYVILGDIIDRNWSAGNETKRDAVNASTAANWPNYANAYIPLSATFNDYTDLAKFNADGVHLADAGYQTVANLFGAKVALA